MRKAIYLKQNSKNYLFKFFLIFKYTSSFEI